MSSALILLDLQNDFMPGGAWPVEDGAALIKVVNDLIGKFSVIVATQLWHPAGHLSFAASHRGRGAREAPEGAGTTQPLLPTHCVAGTAGAELHPGLDCSVIRHIVRRGLNPQVPADSGFSDADRRMASGLAGILRRARIDSLYLCGLPLETTVLRTVTDAQLLGFRTFVVADACRGRAQPGPDHDRQFDQMRNLGASICQSADLVPHP